MANTSISQLNDGSDVSGTDLFPDVQTVGVGPVKVTATQLSAFFWESPYFTGTASFTGAASFSGTASFTKTASFASNSSFVTPSTTTGAYQYWNNGSVNVAAIGGYSDSSTSGHLEFYTTTGSALTERVRVDSSGQVGIGATPAAGQSLSVGKSITGSATCYGIYNSGQIQSDATSQVNYNITVATTASVVLAAAYNVTALYHYRSNQGAIGTNSSVGTQYGFYADSTLVGATSNYGFFSANTSAITAGKTSYGFFGASNIATGGGSAWNIYINGTAPNLFAGTTIIGKAALATNATEGFLYIPTCAGAPTGVPSAHTGTVAMVYDSTNNNFYIYNGAWKKVTLT